VLALAAACTSAASTEPATPASPPVDREAVTAEATRVLDDFHDAAARADEERYFSHMAEDGVFLGTDATERWDKAAFRAYAHPHFASGRAWTLRSTRREIAVGPRGDIVWFDEDLESETLGPTRGSGVLVRGEDGVLRVAQYNLAFTIPNERFAEVRDLLQQPPARADASDPPGVIVIVPGRRIGPIELGMSRARVTALGPLATHPEYSAMTIPWTVYYDDHDLVHQVEISLPHSPHDIRVDAVTIPKTSGQADIERLLGDCTAPDVREGGTMIPCRSGGLFIAIGSGSPSEVWLRMSTPPE
jgi:ketosteroid isomerase-like protein